MRNIIPESGGLFGGFLLVQDHKGLSHTRPGHTFDKMAVDGGADAEGEQVGLTQVLADKVEDLIFNVNVAISGHHDNAGGTGVRRQGQGALEGRGEFQYRHRQAGPE